MIPVKLMLTALVTLTALSKCGGEKHGTGSEKASTLTADTSTGTKAQETTLTTLRDMEEPVIRIEKTYCFGRCPVFIAEIYGNGILYYNGKMNVENVGEFSGTAGPEMITAILEKARSVSFMEMDTLYNTNGPTDVPSTIITIRDGNTSKKVEGRWQVPHAFTELADFITQQVESVKVTPLK